MPSMVSRLLASVERDDDYPEVLRHLTEELKDPGAAEHVTYKRVLLGVAAAMETVDTIEGQVELNQECLVMLEDLAKHGRATYPWKLVQVLLFVVWSRLFDELYDAEVAARDSRYSKEEYLEEKKKLLCMLLQFEAPPITLQRLAEIPLIQPYRKTWKLFHAYRKLVSVGTVPPEKCVPLCCDGTDEAIEGATKHLETWLTDLKDTEESEWDGDLCLEDPEEGSGFETGPTKRPLDGLV